tara:strand:+ start:1805 stop:2599 length:795 start_codon:yes stop_codon:yes gene_type:complete
MKKIIFFLFIFYSSSLLSQSNDQFFFSGNLNINNNGIDWVPLFTRDKPSLIANFTFVNKRFSARSLVRYELDGFQPWGVDFYWNYQFIQNEKIKFDFGAFLPGVFTQRVRVNEKNLPNEILQPWVNAMINPNFTYNWNQNFSLRLSYYHGFPIDYVNTDQFDSVKLLFLTPMIKNIHFSSFYINLIPQLYTVKIDDLSTGIFLANTISIGLLKSNFYISSVINKPIKFGGLSGKKFNWNIGLNYSFKFNFIQKKGIKDESLSFK